ncbi:MAG: hypothetical protein ACK52N_00870, partial [Lysobacteraceae bacterium]
MTTVPARRPAAKATEKSMKANRLFGPLVLAALSSTFLAVASGASAPAGSTAADPVAQGGERRAIVKTRGRALDTVGAVVEGE